jgi:hypothetical protein
MGSDSQGGITKTGGDRTSGMFKFNHRGSLVVDRDALHASPGYARQVAALAQLRAMRGTSDCIDDRQSI